MISRQQVAVILCAALAAACGQSAPMPTAPSAVERPELAGGSFGVLTVDGSASVDRRLSASADLGACLATPGSAGCSAAERFTAQAIGDPPGAPGNLTASANGGVVTLNWTAAASSDPLVSYIVEAGSVPGAANLANVATGTAVPGLVTGGVPAGTYYVRVRAATALAIGPASNEAVLVVGGGGGCAGAPAAPGNLTIASNAGGRVVLTWTASPSGGVTYLLQVGSAPGAANLLQSATAATSVTANGVAAGTYYVRVLAQSVCGTSGPSNEVTVSVGGGAVPNVNVAGTWDLTAAPGRFRPYSQYVVTISQSGTTLTGSILPIGGSRGPTRLNGTVSGSTVRFGSETAWWNDVINGVPDIGADFYFSLTLDATGRTMTGVCLSGGGCGPVVAVKR